MIEFRRGARIPVRIASIPATVNTASKAAPSEASRSPGAAASPPCLPAAQPRPRAVNLYLHGYCEPDQSQRTTAGFSRSNGLIRPDTPLSEVQDMGVPSIIATVPLTERFCLPSEVGSSRLRLSILPAGPHHEA